MDSSRLLWKAVAKEGTLESSSRRATGKQRATWCRAEASPALSGVWAR